MVLYSAGNTTCEHCVTIRPFEAVVVLSLFLVWAIALALFLQYWNELHINDTREVRARPKNLSTVKVCTKVKIGLCISCYVSPGMCHTLYHISWIYHTVLYHILSVDFYI